MDFLISSSSIKKEFGTLDCGDDFCVRDEDFMRYVFALVAFQCDIAPKSSNETLEAIIPPSSSNDGPFLKQLHKNLCYAFLREDLTLLVVIVASFSKEKEENLLVVLWSYKSWDGRFWI